MSTLTLKCSLKDWPIDATSMTSASVSRLSPPSSPWPPLAHTTPGLHYPDPALRIQSPSGPPNILLSMPITLSTTSTRVDFPSYLRHWTIHGNCKDELHHGIVLPCRVQVYGEDARRPKWCPTGRWWGSDKGQRHSSVICWELWLIWTYFCFQTFRSFFETYNAM